MNEQILWSKIASKYHLSLWRRSDEKNRYAITEDSKPPKDGVYGAPRQTVVTHFKMRISKIETPTNISELAEFFPG